MKKTVAANIAHWNDDNNLLELVSLVRPYLDEIVVVNDGPLESEDTRGKLLAFDVTLFETPRRSGLPEKAKRIALALTNSDWLFCVDTDERPSQSLLESLCSIVSHDGQPLAYQVKVNNFYDGKPWNTSWPNRLVRVTFDRQMPDMLHVGYSHSCEDENLLKLEDKSFYIDHHPDVAKYDTEKNSRYDQINLWALDRYGDVPELERHILDCIGGRLPIREAMSERGYEFNEADCRYYRAKQQPVPIRRVAAQVICHNEDDALERLLPSIRQHVDEIILVSDGPLSARTRGLAAAYGATAAAFPREMRHAAPARRLALALQESEWTFVIDPDETVSEELLSSLRYLANRPDVCAYKVSVPQLMDGKVIQPSRHYRLFRLLPYMQWPYWPHSAPEGIGSMNAGRIIDLDDGMGMVNAHVNADLPGMLERYGYVCNSLMDKTYDLPRERQALVDIITRGQYPSSLQHFQERGWI